jgi:hypothetical protein
MLRATKALYPALSMCDLIFSGVVERHPRYSVANIEFELAWRPTCSPRWATPSASATARRFTGSGVPKDHDRGIAGGKTARVYRFGVARLAVPR